MIFQTWISLSVTQHSNSHLTGLWCELNEVIAVGHVAKDLPSLVRKSCFLFIIGSLEMVSNGVGQAADHTDGSVPGEYSWFELAPGFHLQVVLPGSWGLLAYLIKFPKTHDSNQKSVYYFPQKQTVLTIGTFSPCRKLLKCPVNLAPNRELGTQAED